MNPSKVRRDRLQKLTDLPNVGPAFAGDLGAEIAAREVILCGGTFNSPQLLQLSGVGSRALLEQHGVPVVLDAPEVGENLQDHYYVRTFWKCNKPITLNDDMMSLWRQARIGLQYLLFKRGPLTVSAGYAAAFLRTRPELTRPDAQLYFINFSTAKRGGHLHPFSGLPVRCRSCRSNRAAGSGCAMPTRPHPRRSSITTSPPKTTSA